MKYFLFLCTVSLILFACKTDQKPSPVADSSPFTTEVSDFGTTEGGQVVKEFTLSNEQGMVVKAINYGAIITEIHVPDKEGQIADVVLGFNDLAEYEKADPYFGAVIGRYGNRIANASFSLNGKTYELEANDGTNNLHGGPNGFHERVWETTGIEMKDGKPSVAFTLTSEAGEGGYPGTVNATVTYTLTEDNQLVIDYVATTDEATPINLTQHSYFNLSGNTQEPILDHVLQIDAEQYLPVDDRLIPTGEIATVADTPMDFRTAKAIGRDIEVEKEQLSLGRGFDHCWVFGDRPTALRDVATLHHEASGRVMTVATTEPGIQFYSGNFLNGTLPAKGGGSYGHRTGLCLETQHFPDSPNQENFPTTIVQPNETYKTTTIYKFSIK